MSPSTKNMFNEHRFELYKMACEIGISVFLGILAYNFHSTISNLQIADDKNTAYIERIAETSRLNSLAISSLTEIAKHNKEQVDRLWIRLERK